MEVILLDYIALERSKMEIINPNQPNGGNSSRCATDALAPPHTGGEGNCTLNCSCIGKEAPCYTCELGD